MWCAPCVYSVACAAVKKDGTWCIPQSDGATKGQSFWPGGGNANEETRWACVWCVVQVCFAVSTLPCYGCYVRWKMEQHPLKACCYEFCLGPCNCSACAMALHLDHPQRSTKTLQNVKSGATVLL